MAAGARLGGHIVQGHVDGTARLLDRTPSEHWDVLRFSLPADLARYLVEKGSITVDGVSLTVVEVVDADPEAGRGLVLGVAHPHHARRHHARHPQPGDRVNLEVDVLAKYVERLLAAQAKGDRT